MAKSGPVLNTPKQVSVLELDDDDDDSLPTFDLKSATSVNVHANLKAATQYGLTQSMTKWLLVDEHQALLQSKFTCVRWSQTKGFIVLKKYDASSANDKAVFSPKNNKANELILFVDFFGVASTANAMQGWLSSNFVFGSKLADDEKQQQQIPSLSKHKVITLQSLYNILKANWDENAIKVSDRKVINGVIEFQITQSKKQLQANSFYQSLNDLSVLLEDIDIDEQQQSRTIELSQWVAKKPPCLAFKVPIGIDVMLTMSPVDDALLSGHVFLIYDEQDDSVFLTIQYEIGDGTQLKFAGALLQEFGIEGDETKNMKKMMIKDMMTAVQKLLNEHKLQIQVSDEYDVHKEVLFVVSAQ